MMISQMIARGIYFLFMLVEQEKYTHSLSVTVFFGTCWKCYIHKEKNNFQHTLSKHVG